MSQVSENNHCIGVYNILLSILFHGKIIFLGLLHQRVAKSASTSCEDVFPWFNN